MGIFKATRLYRAEITEKCLALRMSEVVTNKHKRVHPIHREKEFAVIPVGIKGWVVKRFGMLFFLPDANQEGLDQFVQPGNDSPIIACSRIQGHYKIIDEN